MPLIYQSYIQRVDLKANPSVTYVFGDNEARVGFGGQAAEMRGEPNAIGIATKRSPSEFWNQRETARQCAVIDADMAPLFSLMRQGRLIVFPLAGVGTGLAMLKLQAPATMLYLHKQIDALSQIKA